MNTRVLVCSRRAQSAATKRTDVTVVDEMCRHPDRIESAIEDADRLVLGVCEGDYSLGTIQAEVRRLGVDPLGVELIDPATIGWGTGRFDVVLNAKVARAEAFAGSSTVNAKLTFPRTANRRELFRGLPHQYQSAPSIDPDLCSADSGCRACVDVCPQDALDVRDRRIHHERSVCEPCGLCGTTCPTGATVNPATTPAQLVAEISALLDPSVGPDETRGIVFTCSRGGTPAMPAGWYSVTVPCTGMTTPGWMLAPLLMGAGAVAAHGCADSGCPLGHDARTATAVDFCRAFLRSLGESPERVPIEPRPNPPEPMPRSELIDPFGPRGAVELMLALAAGHDDARGIVIDHPGAPTGMVQMSAESCTACTMCAQICPTEALMSARSDDHVTISFDAARCTACAQCIRTCPEIDRNAISMQTRVDLAALSRGPSTLIEVETLRCESCGGSIAPVPMMARITSMLGGDDDPVRAMITRRCIPCRGVAS